MISNSVGYRDLGLERQDVYEALGYAGNALPDLTTQQEVAQLLQQVELHLDASYTFVTRSIDTLQRFDPGRIILSQIRDSQAVCYFVATVGHWFENEQRHLMEQGDIVKVYLMNEIGSLLAEKVADQVELALEKQISPKGLHHTNRFSPGYCGWQVSEQPLLFEMFGKDANTHADDSGFGQNTAYDALPSPCGIKLTESSLMIPIKSVSGIIGIGKDVRKHDYKCNACGLESCYKRRI